MLALLTSAVLVVAMAVPAAAGDNGKGKGKDKGKKDQKAHGHPAVEVSVHFSSEQRHAVESFFVEQHGRGGCPPGLAKKNNGCLPPGQAKKLYTVGQPLPKGVPTAPPPAEIRVKIGEPPAGYLYVMVDSDLVKLAVGTMMVVDAIDGLVN